ncbi:MAG: sulfotransferase family protein [Pyrinomonadaceae bacterium]
MNLDTRRLRGWLPVRFHMRSTGLELDWCYLGEQRLTDPFFDDTIARQLHYPFNLFFQPRTTIQTLAEFETHFGRRQPAGLIYHWSRCGSTLVTQMFAALERNTAVSEASVIDAVLRCRRWQGGIQEEQQIEWLRGMVSALGQNRDNADENVFIKFDSWHVIFLPLLQRAFPRVPAIFVYRDPLEIMASQMNSRAAFMLPGTPDALVFDFSTTEMVELSPEQYIARVLAAIGRLALAGAREHKLMLLNYHELPAAMETRIAPHFGVKFDREEWATMHAATVFNAKNPALKFSGDTEAKRRAATPEMLNACAEWLDPLYSEFEAVRLEQIGTN